MEDFKNYLNKLLGRDPEGMELEAFAPFNPFESDREKSFLHYNPSRPLFLNIDDEHYVYISNHTNRMRCCLDMATRNLESTACYRHEHGTIMLGVTKPENEKHVKSQHINYHIYIQSAGVKSAAESLTAVSKFADHISLIRDESPWERLCRICVDINTGGHITASSQRLFKHYKDGLIYIVPDHQHVNFTREGQTLDTTPVFIGKTVPYPILSLDNEKGLLEIPLSTLKTLQKEQLKNNPGPHSQSIENEDNDPLDNIEEHPKAIDQVIAYVQNEQAAYPEMTYSFKENIPDLRVDAIPLKGLSFTKNGIELHTLRSIVDLSIRGIRPIALSYYLETTADYPQEIEFLLNVIKKSAKLFGIPVANNCIVPGKNNRLKLFFVSRNETPLLSHAFQRSGDFICLLGDPNGVLNGSAYAYVHGREDAFTPPGVMTGTLAALVDVVRECAEKNIITSAALISRGGLITTLKHAGESGLGAAIYSERKGPEQVFIFGEPQAAALVTIKENHLIDLARITSNYNLTSTTIGRVTDNPEIMINNKTLISLNK